MSRGRDVDAWMWAEACALLGRAGQLHARFFQLAPVEPARTAWEPPVDVFEDDGELVVVVAMPGVAPDKVEVAHEPGELVVRGVRSLPAGAPGRRVRQLEIPYGTFERRLPLPPGPLEVGRPELSDGCLVLRLRKVGRAR